jgi:catechol 2,3-dioxygenase-like lactoylglutathione lyase family enzyme
MLRIDLRKSSQGRSIQPKHSRLDCVDSIEEFPVIASIDHLVLTTHNEAACIGFYTELLGMRLDAFVGADGRTRKAFVFGSQKINLHVKGAEFEPKAHLPVPGAVDLCLIAAVPLDAVIQRLNAYPWPILEGPVNRTGACGPILSVYLRDPDLNLIEISQYIS